MSTQALQMINSFWVSLMFWVIGIASIQGIGAIVFLALNWRMKKPGRLFKDGWYSQEKDKP